MAGKEGWRKMLDWILLALGILMTVLSVLPLFYRISHMGVWISLAGGVFLAGYSLLRGRLPQSGGFLVLDRIFLLLAALAAAGTVAVSLFMAFGYSRYQPGEQVDTVIVLGCKVRGDRPSKMLRCRLDAAAEILLANPGSRCVVSGGQGPDEQYPESQVMKSYLTERGISPDRILKEDQSTSTRENLAFTKDLLGEADPGHTVVVTDRFHLYRGCYYAKEQGFSVKGEAGYTNPALLYSYWMREIPAVILAWLSR